MSQQNIKNWKDFHDRTLDIGQRVVAVRGSTMHIGEILWFTPTGVTINSENKEGLVYKVNIMHNGHGGSFLILPEPV